MNKDDVRKMQEYVEDEKKRVEINRRKLELWAELINVLKIALEEIDFDDANRVEVRDEIEKLLAKAAELEGTKP